MKKIAMKSSPRSNEISPSAGSKTPASGKKLVQARLPFKALGGSEPPFSVTNDTSDTTSLASDKRKRKPNDVAPNADGIRATKLNRGDNISLETNEIMELSNDIPTENETENGKKFTIADHMSESKENVCDAKHTSDEIDLTDSEGDLESATHEPKAKQSLDFEKKHSESRKSKRTNESNLITIRLPMTKKSKAKKVKKHKKTTENDNVQSEHEDAATTEEDEEKEDESSTTEINVDVTMAELEIVDHSKSGSHDEGGELNDSVVSNPPEQCSTPNNHKLTPKQMQRRLESEKKKQEKEQARLERERKLQEERELRQREKERQKQREREEKEEQRKKEKEMRDKKLLEEKLEKQRDKEQKEQQRKIEREEKEEQRKREREERELQKKKEREDKEREKEEERKKREDEKRQKMEAEQSKNRKMAEGFAKFFVPKKVDNKSESNDLSGEHLDCAQMPPQTFMSFQVKDDMKMAPITRRALNADERSCFEHLLSSGILKNDLYLSQLKHNILAPRKSSRTWSDDEDEKSCNDDLFVIEENGQNVQVLKEEPKKLYRAKFFKFSENRRPPYYGTWRKKSKTINARKPLALDSQLDYDVDSDDEWEEEEPGESVESEDEKETESEDDYEIDNEFFVPHGHLSDEELLQDEDEPEFNPADLKIKLKLAQNEFDDERKKKTQKLKPRLIGFIWQNMDGSKPDNCSNGVWELLNRSAMLFKAPSVKVEQPINQSADNSDDENSNANKTLGVRRLQIGEKDIPDLIRLINGNPKTSKFLVKEFCAYLAKKNQPQREYSGASIKAKIKELAIWGACPEEGPMYKKMCWYVPIDTRKRYNLNDLSLPNTWCYTIQLPRADTAAASNTDGKESEKAVEPLESIQLSDDSNSCNFASETLTPELIEQAKSKKANYNIAKFIRALTDDEKKKQFEPITFNRRPSEEQPNDTPSTSPMTSSKSKKARATKRAASSTPESTVPKKRINLLMSGPVGQDFSPRLKNTLVTQFLNSNVKKQNSTDRTDGDANGISLTNSAGTSEGAKKEPHNDPVIVID